jgi:outer membrane protein TolC
MQSALARKGTFDAVVNVYKAVGGGWVDEAAVYAPQPKPPEKSIPIL